MNQPYFGAYRGGFQTLPSNAYEMMTAPTKQNAQTIGMVTGALGGAISANQAAKAGTAAFEQGSAAQYSGLQSMSQATGVPMNPELANQYMNIGQMSPQQQAAFQNSLGQEAQRIQSLYNISNQQRQVQQSGQNLYRQGLNQAISAYVEPMMPMSGSGASNVGAVPTTPDMQPVIDASLFPPAQYSTPVYGGAYDNYGSMMPRVGTLRL